MITSKRMPLNFLSGIPAKVPPIPEDLYGLLGDQFVRNITGPMVVDIYESVIQ